MYVVEYTELSCDKDHQQVLVGSHRSSLYDHDRIEKIVDSGNVQLANRQ